MDQIYPFHPELWPRRIAHPEERQEGPRLHISWEHPSLTDRDEKRAMEAWIDVLPSLRGVTAIKVWAHVTQSLFEALCEVRDLTHLQAKWSNIQRLDSISNLRRLTHLYIGSSTRIESIGPLSSLSALEFLEIENFKKISDFSPLLALRSLRSLSVTGSMWSRQDVGSLEPFSKMTWLESLGIDTSRVKSIQSLAHLKQLKFLGIGGRLPWEEYARLAGQLPKTECMRFDPFLDISESGYSPCKKCKQKSMVMLTGRGMPTICRFCDEAKLKKHVDRFDKLRAESSMSGVAAVS